MHLYTKTYRVKPNFKEIDIHHFEANAVTPEAGETWLTAEENDVRQAVKVEIHTLSEKLYQNLHSQELASGITDDIFSEPVKIYTNRWLRHIGYLQCYRKEKIGSGKWDMKKTHQKNRLL
jgi:hypothetical protein